MPLPYFTLHAEGWHPEIALCGFATLDTTPVEGLVSCTECLNDLEEPKTDGEY